MIMVLRALAAYAFLVVVPLFAHVRSAVECGSLKREFDICQQWREGMTWGEFLCIRNRLQRSDLIKYVDKLEQQKLALNLGLEIPKTYLVSREKVPFIDLIAGMHSYVAKVTHMSLSQGLIIVRDGINLITGEPITPEEVQARIFASLDEKPREIESWALHNVAPGFIIQEYIPNRAEVKVQTVWGKAVIGEWRGGEPKTPTTPIWGRYDRDGHLVDGTEPSPEWWSRAIDLAELVAKDTDALRVDFLVKEGGVLLLNELEIWPESDWRSMKTALEDRLNAGYYLKTSDI